MNKKTAVLILFALFLLIVVAFALFYQKAKTITPEVIPAVVEQKTLTEEKAEKQTEALSALVQVAEEIKASSTLVKEQVEKQVEALKGLEQVSQEINASSTLVEERERMQAEVLKMLEQVNERK